MGNELKKYRVTGPDGFDREYEPGPLGCNDADGALNAAFNSTPLSSINSISRLLRQAGYRAEPIEEPKMVTVRAEDLNELYWFAHKSAHEWTDQVRGSACRLRAAFCATLDGGK